MSLDTLRHIRYTHSFSYTQTLNQKYCHLFEKTSKMQSATASEDWGASLALGVITFSTSSFFSSITLLKLSQRHLSVVIKKECSNEETAIIASRLTFNSSFRFPLAFSQV